MWIIEDSFTENLIPWHFDKCLHFWLPLCVHKLIHAAVDTWNRKKGVIQSPEKFEINGFSFVQKKKGWSRVENGIGQSEKAEQQCN